MFPADGRLPAALPVFATALDMLFSRSFISSFPIEECQGAPKENSPTLSSRADTTNTLVSINVFLGAQQCLFHPMYSLTQYTHTGKCLCSMSDSGEESEGREED